ncbi:3103_t:CDS:2, partial [Dentiscutata heterogama]
VKTLKLWNLKAFGTSEIRTELYPVEDLGNRTRKQRREPRRRGTSNLFSGLVDLILQEKSLFCKNHGYYILENEPDAILPQAGTNGILKNMV